jgi:hypothetical protein
VEGAMPSKGINEINGLLSLHLSRYVSNKILDIQNDLEYFDIRLSEVQSGRIANIFPGETTREYTYKILELVDMSCLPCSIPLHDVSPDAC